MVNNTINYKKFSLLNNLNFIRLYNFILCYYDHFQKFPFKFNLKFYF